MYILVRLIAQADNHYIFARCDVDNKDDYILWFDEKNSPASRGVFTIHSDSVSEQRASLAENVLFVPGVIHATDAADLFCHRS
jgi:hypothetical protein